MQKTLSLVAILTLAVALSGCDGEETNRLIIATNAERVEAFGNGLVACGDNAACQVAISMAFAGGLGQQQIFRPETVVDYLREVRMWIDPVGNLIDRLNGGYGGVSGDRAASVIRGDGNLVMIGNRAKSDNGSTAGFSLNSAYTRSWSGYNREFTGQQPITDEGLGEVK